MSLPSRAQRLAELRPAAFFVLSLAVLAAGCGGSPAAPTQPDYPPTPSAPELQCSNVAGQSLDGGPASVSFAVTVRDGTGVAPVSIACTPSSGTVFPLGATPVQCVATDAIERTGSCEFQATVLPPPHLSATRIVAFGNSITEGKNNIGGIDLAAAYPGVLQTLLSARYQTQVITVFNEGRGGETTGDGKWRLDTILGRDNPQALLLEEGVNDLIDYPDESVIPSIVDNLRTMIRKGQAMGARVFVATLLPERPGTQRGGWVSTLIVPTNDRIRPMVVAEGAVLVDLYEAFAGVPDPYIGPDGLHPNALGYQKIAETFYSALQAAMEVPTLSTGLLVSPGNIAGTRFGGR